jgi:hypothetical protein
VETISGLHLIPVLEAMLHQFLFRILGFHSDNGSEYLHGQVAAMLIADWNQMPASGSLWMGECWKKRPRGGS